MKIVIRGSTLKNISKWALGQPTSVSYHYIDKDVVTLFSHRGHFTLLNNFKFNTMSTFSRLYQHTLTRVTFSMQEFYLWHHLYLIQKCLNKSWEEKNAFFLFFSKENINKTNIVTLTSVTLTKKSIFHAGISLPSFVHTNKAITSPYELSYLFTVVLCFLAAPRWRLRDKVVDDR